ncbi:MAG TPA: hypothetical protein VK166_05465 [Chitinophagaceae bacterium]|nr:hypothetical protein [Chitinophagaceae bacterium]
MKLLLTIFLFVSILAKAQDLAQPPARQWKGNFIDFAPDNLGNLYLLTTDYQLKKFSVKGDSMGVFNDVKRYGKLTTINASNPLRTILYYKDFRTVLVLDRLLNAVNTIDLRKLNIFQVKAVAPAYDNSIWVFDEQESKLKKIGEDGKLLSETADLRLVLDEAPLPQKIFDQNGFVYLYDPSKGIFIFDYYGALKNRIALIDWKNLQVLGNNIVGIKDGKILSYKTGTLEISETPVPQFITNSKDLHITPVGIYVMDSGGVSLYSFSGY